MKREATRPSKKLVPSLCEDMRCEHTYTHDGAMTLEIECGECSGAQRIDNPKCASGIVNILASGVRPDSIVLKRFIHMRYRGDKVYGLCESARALAALRRLQTQEAGASDTRCQTCPASRSSLAEEMIRRMREEPASFAHRRASLSDEIRSRASKVDCSRADACAAEVLEAGSSAPWRG